MRLKRRQIGFTLIELLVALSLIALMLAILTPSLSRARQTAYTIVCKNTLRGLTQAHYIYYTMHRRLLPKSVQDEERGIPMRPWFVMDDYRSLLSLPLLSREYQWRYWGNLQEYKPSYPKKFICPMAKVALDSAENGLYPIDRSYGVNAHVYFFEDYIKMRLNSQSGSIMLMADGLDWWFNCWECDKFVTYGEQWLGFETYGMAAFRHQQKANTSFWDGHVEQMTAPELKAHLMEWLELEKRRSGR